MSWLDDVVAVTYGVVIKALIDEEKRMQQKELGAVFLNVIKDESLPTKRFRIYDTEVQANMAICGPVEHRAVLARIIAEIPPPDIRLSLSQLDDVFNSWRTDELARTVSLYDYIKIKLFGTGAVNGQTKN